MSRLGRLPIRVRVTLAFTAVMSVVLAAVGLFLYLRLEAQLNESNDQGLRSRAGEVSALVRASPTGLGRIGRSSLIEPEESFAQLLTSRGQVIDSTRQLRGRPALSPEQAEGVASPTFFEVDRLPGLEGRVRVLATPVDAQGRRLIAVVGSSLQDRDETLAGFVTLLLIGGPAALLLASLAGYGAAATALRQVEAMRRRAAAISASGPDERLPVPAGRDELTRLGETLNEMLGRLEAALERERRFVDDASHELRTPLALHKTELELALRYATGEGELRDSIASAIEEIDRLIQLAEDLLVVARSEEGKLAVSPEPVPVEALFATIGERFRARVAELRRPLSVEGTDGLVIEADRLRLEQALTSMVDNALRYGGGEIRLWARTNGGLIQLHVSDSGPGFPPEFIGRAFERFSRADAARSRGGSGLGLAIVETIASAHRGRVGAVNDPGGGADVWIEVPAAGTG
jgi:two-component system OmpR family sensor kinase